MHWVERHRTGGTGDRMQLSSLVPCSLSGKIYQQFAEPRRGASDNPDRRGALRPAIARRATHSNPRSGPPASRASDGGPSLRESPRPHRETLQRAPLRFSPAAHMAAVNLKSQAQLEGVVCPHRLRSNPGGTITTPSVHTAAWDIARGRLRRSFRQASHPAAALRRSPSLAEKPSMH